MSDTAPFRGRLLPALLVLPQLAVTAVFFLWPAAEAVRQSLMQEDPFGLTARFTGLANYQAVLSSPQYLDAIGHTVVFSAGVTALSLAGGLVLAALAERVIRGSMLYRTLLVWPYAVAPAVAAAIWWLALNPSIGVLAWLLQQAGYPWNHQVSGTDAMILVIVAAAWHQVSYNMLFFLAGMQAIPRSLIEAAAIDGAGPWRRFRTIVLPLLSPTTFFLAIVDLVYAFFETFAIIHATTMGGPARATEILVYKVFKDGFIGLDMGGSAAQSVILMVLVIGLTALQFRYVERRVHY